MAAMRADDMCGLSIQLPAGVARMTGSPSSGIDPALSLVLATVLDAVVIMSPEGVILGWNGAAEMTFGHSEDEARGRHLGILIVPVQHRAAHQQGLERIASGGEPHVLNRRIEISAIHRDGHEFPIELSITTANTSSGTVFVGFIRDITERRRAEEKIERQADEARLMFEIASMASESDSFDSALRNTLEAICKVTGWPVGHAFIVPAGNQRLLRSSGIWVEAKEGLSLRMREATEAIAFKSGVGLPGQILETGEPKWVCDTDAEPDFPRKGHGFLGAFGFPLKRDGRTIAVLEFFSASEAPPEPSLLLTVRALGEQVGRVFERKRTQDHQGLLMHELNHRVKNILSVVQAVAQQTLRRANSVEQAYEDLRGRLMAIAQAQDVLVSQNASGATLEEIIIGALRGSGVDVDRVEMSGPEVRVSTRNAVTVSLAIHELCTNALKYGSLSNELGSVNIMWDFYSVDSEVNFRFIWREKGGPAVVPPQSKGFGTSLLERGLAGELGGDLALEYSPGGLICRFTGPVATDAIETDNMNRSD